MPKIEHVIFRTVEENRGTKTQLLLILLMLRLINFKMIWMIFSFLFMRNDWLTNLKVKRKICLSSPKSEEEDSLGYFEEVTTNESKRKDVFVLLKD